MSSHERDLHDTDLSRLYRQGVQSEPSPEVDERIRLAAHQAVQRRGPAWWKLASTAAVLVLSFALVTETLFIDPVEEKAGYAPPSLEEMAQPAPAPRAERKGEPAEKGRLQSEKKFTRPADMERPRFSPSSSAGLNAPDQMRQAPASLPAEAIGDSTVIPKAERALDAEKESLPVCNGYTLPVSNSENDWLKLAAELREKGDLQALACLSTAFVERFGKQLPENAELRQLPSGPR